MSEKKIISFHYYPQTSKEVDFFRDAYMNHSKIQVGFWDMEDEPSKLIKMRLTLVIE